MRSCRFDVWWACARAAVAIIPHPPPDGGPPSPFRGEASASSPTVGDAFVCIQRRRGMDVLDGRIISSPTGVGLYDGFILIEKGFTYMRWTKDKLDLFFAMKDEGCSIDEICVALGCGRQTVYDKVKNLKKMNGGKLPKPDGHKNDAVINEKFEDVINSVDAGKRTVEGDCPCKDDGGSGGERVSAVGEGLAPPARTDICPDIGDGIRTDAGEHSSPLRGDFAVRAATEAEAGTPTDTDAATDTPPAAFRPKKPDIYDLMYEAKYMASGRGFEPDHIRIDVDDVRSEVIVSGKGSDGKVHEIRYSVTDPIYFEAVG